MDSAACRQVYVVTGMDWNARTAMLAYSHCGWPMAKASAGQHAKASVGQRGSLTG